LETTDPAEQPRNTPQSTPQSPPQSAPQGTPQRPPQGTPPPPSTPPVLRGADVDLRVSKRLLWVGGAAYPLQNIARVYTFTLQPRRKEATVRFLKNVAITLAVATTLHVLSSLTSSGSSLGGGGGNEGNGFTPAVWSIAGLALAYFLFQLLTVVGAPSHYVLAVETSGSSTALVTSPNPEHLNHLVGYITHAIDNPESEFQVTVESITISPKNYYFGDNVNMYGGTGNVGMAA
jgi:hypothetical protein